MSQATTTESAGSTARLHAPLAYLPEGWARDVLLEVGADGGLAAVTPDSTGEEARSLDGIVVPGVPNLHSHAFQRAMSGLTETFRHRSEEEHTPDTFWSWRETMYRFLRVLSPEDVEAVAAYLFVEMLRAGYTSVAEFHYLHLDPEGNAYPEAGELSRRVIRAAGRSGIGITHLPTLYRTGGFGGRPPGAPQARFLLEPEALIDLVTSLREEHRETADVEVGLALHSLRAVPIDDVQWAVDRLRREAPEAPVHIHVAEQVREVEESVAWSGLRPVELLLGGAPVDERWCLVHATHATEDELESVVARGAVVGLCPTTEANLGDGLFPLPAHMRLRGRFGIGSDSHVSVSPVEELRWLEYGQRLLRRERNVAGRVREGSSGRALFDAVLEGGRRACGRPVGRIAAGERADLVVLDPAHPDFEGRETEQLLDAWIFSGNRSAVRDVYVGGRPVVQEGRHLDEEEITETYRARLRNILSSL